MSDAIAIYVQIAGHAIPIAIAFGICDLIVSTFFRAAFGGRLKLTKE